MNEILTAIAGIIVGGGTFWGLVRGGFIKIQIGKNGNGKDLKAEIIHHIETNHFHEVGEKLDKLTEKMEKHNEMEIEVLFILKDIKDKLK